MSIRYNLFTELKYKISLINNIRELWHKKQFHLPLIFCKKKVENLGYSETLTMEVNLVNYLHKYSQKTNRMSVKISFKFLQKLATLLPL